MNFLVQKWDAAGNPTPPEVSMFEEVSVVCCGTNGIQLSQEKGSLVSGGAAGIRLGNELCPLKPSLGGDLFLLCSSAFGIHSSCF